MVRFYLSIEVNRITFGVWICFDTSILHYFLRFKGNKTWSRLLSRVIQINFRSEGEVAMNEVNVLLHLIYWFCSQQSNVTSSKQNRNLLIMCIDALNTSHFKKNYLPFIAIRCSLGIELKKHRHYDWNTGYNNQVNATINTDLEDYIQRERERWYCYARASGLMNIGS